MTKTDAFFGTIYCVMLTNNIYFIVGYYQKKSMEGEFRHERKWIFGIFMPKP